MNLENPGEIADLIAANVFVNLKDKMKILEETDIEKACREFDCNYASGNGNSPP